MTGVQTSCRETERVAEYALRAMTDAERSMFDTHVRTCQECRGELDALSLVIDGFVHWPTDVLRPPAPIWSRVAKRLGVEAREPERRWTSPPQWVQAGEGVYYKLLALDEAKGRVSLLVRLAPNAEYPPHTHADLEELHLLEGELWIDDRKLHAGDYNRAEAGTGDKRVWSETGCTCVLVTSMNDVLG